MQQRVAMARALAIEPQILFMDEPLSSLDALSRERLQTLILEVWRHKQITTILVTHSIEEAVYLGRRIIVLSRRPGRILEIVDNPGAGDRDYRQTEQFFRNCNQLRRILKEEDDGPQA
jgi:NitT/TauT family transport system ATP-binding protein